MLTVAAFVVPLVLLGVDLLYLRLRYPGRRIPRMPNTSFRFKLFGVVHYLQSRAPYEFLQSLVTLAACGSYIYYTCVAAAPGLVW